MSRKRSNADNAISFRKLCEFSEKEESKIHFIGIGGVSMYSLASVCLSRGISVSGSDREKNERTELLVEKGAEIVYKHNESNINNSDLVVYSHAISTENPELTEAKRLGIPCVNRAEFLGALMMRYPMRIGVSGSHGKSTTVAMLEHIFTRANLFPTVMSGAKLPCGEPYKIGSYGMMIYEACEYKDSFLNFFPTVAIALNLEMDHPDYFSDVSDLKKSFIKALSRATDYALVCLDDNNLKCIRDEIKTRLITFGKDESSDYRYEIISYRDCGFDVSLFFRGKMLGNIELNIPGEFNVANAVAAATVALEYGLDFNVIKDALNSFSGIERRLEYIGERYGRPVFYDYAHHPTEIALAINALKLYTNRSLTVIFKPHTFSRTKALWKEMVNSLSLADYLILTDIYPAREEAIENVSSKRLAEDIGNGAIYCSDGDVLLALDIYTRGAIVIMGAGELEQIKTDVLNKKE